MLKTVRARLLASGLGTLLLFCSACGAAAGATPAAGGTSGAAHGPAGARGGRAPRALNPAMRAAIDVIRLEPVVPFTSAQVQKIVPLLQGLAKAPNASASQLASEGQAIEAQFTATQQEALKNMAAAGPTGAAGATGSAGGGFGPGGRGFPPGGGRGRFSRSGSGAGGTPPGPAAIYQRAISILQGAGSSTGSSASGTGTA